jgi:hypothetical protein
MSAGKTRQNPAKKRILWSINEHVESNVNVSWPSGIVFHHPVKLEAPGESSIHSDGIDQAELYKNSLIGLIRSGHN